MSWSVHYAVDRMWLGGIVKSPRRVEGHPLSPVLNTISLPASTVWSLMRVTLAMPLLVHFMWATSQHHRPYSWSSPNLCYLITWFVTANDFHSREFCWYACISMERDNYPCCRMNSLSSCSVVAVRLERPELHIFQFKWEPNVNL